MLLEDVTTSGRVRSENANRLIDMGCDVAACITILDREEEGKTPSDLLELACIRSLFVRTCLVSECRSM